MIGTDLIERLVQAVALSHRVAHRDRASLLLLAAPESGKTTIACAATAKHVVPIAVITGRSVLVEISQHHAEFLLFNDMAAIRSLSKPTSALLITLLNQLSNGEQGIASFAGKDRVMIDKPIGIIGCLPFRIFTDHRARWRDMGFVSRMIPFSYSYNAELIATIKNSIDRSNPGKPKVRKLPDMKESHDEPIDIGLAPAHARIVRALADARAVTLGQIGIRLLKNYHVIIRAHALLHGRKRVQPDDLDFLRAIDQYVSITECKPL